MRVDEYNMRRLSNRLTVLISLTIGLSSFSSAFGEDIKQADSKEAASILVADSHEQQWIVDSIGKDITSILLFAAKTNDEKANESISLSALNFKTAETPGDTTKFSFHLQPTKNSRQSEDRDFTLADYVWSAKNYSPWAEQLIKSYSLQAPKPQHDSDAAFISAIANFTADTVAQQNDRISSGLTAHPLDSSLHEQAALLSALFALRESASCFDDVRPALNRVTAHLAVANALSDGAGFTTTGKLAEITLLTLGGRGADAIKQIDALIKSDTANSPLDESTKSWLRALKVRATTDYRIADLKVATVIEKLQYGRALADDVGSDYLAEYLEKNPPQGPPIDWLRVGARGVSTVQSGHMFSEPAVDAEIQSFKTDLKRYKKTDLIALTELAPLLSALPTGCLNLDSEPELRVISWGDVSAFDARHLMDSLFQKYHFEKSMWGVPEVARASADKADQIFSNVSLYPLYRLSRLWLNHEKADSDMNKVVKNLMDTRPQSVNSTLWHRAIWVAKNKSELPAVTTWFVPRLPFGTAFDFYHRNNEGDPNFSVEELVALKALDPFNRNLCVSLAWAQYPDGKFDLKKLLEDLGPLADYDITAMQEVVDATKSDPVKQAAQLEKMAKYKPDSYFALGKFYVDTAQPEKAKEAYEQGIKLGRNDVAKANQCDWLVNYYFNHNRKKEAYELASFAAEVYSSPGLITMAKLCERMDKLPEAEKNFQNVAERYSDKAPLMSFYQRHASQNAKYKTAADAYLKSLFPGGMLKRQISDFHDAPKSGAQITYTSDLTKKYGVNTGDIVVAVDGTAIDGQKQYRYLMDASPTTTIQFIIWDGHKYRSLAALLPSKRFYCGIEDFPATK